MKPLFTLLFCSLFFFQAATSASAQTLISVEYKGLLPASVMNFALPRFGLSAKNDIEYYTINYTMNNLSGVQDTVSGLYVRPAGVSVDARYPSMVYQHGTTDTKFGVPSRSAPGQDLPYIYATQGYAVLAPDFLNMGDDQEGFHPYVHARTEGMAAIRMMEAMMADPLYADLVNEQLFLTGYSQGGHASMALHEILIEEYPAIEVTAAAHMSGPYSLSDIMLNEVALSSDAFGAPGFMPYTLASYQTVYGNLYTDLSEVFKTEFIAPVQAFIDGYETATVGLSTLNQQLIDGLAAAGNDSMTVELFPATYVADLRANPNHPLIAALRDNDTYNFVNPTPTRLFYCSGDDQVNYLNSPFAADTMTAMGATNTIAVEVGPTLTHTECVIPAVSGSVTFFEDYQQITSSTTQIPGAYAWTYLQTEEGLRIYTNNDQVEYQVNLYDAMGRQLVSAMYRSGQLLDLSQLPTSWAAVQMLDEEGRMTTKSIIVR
ncbi:MAG: alpha/beta hydrolase family protein [Saprospiraceae bacterium]